jgi:TetR/AcrR family transcriptional regulator, transcriptional repressor for nem operon
MRPTQTKRQAAAARTRESLIDAGLRLAERTSLAGLSINLLVAEAGVSKGTFFHHFGDRASYLLALHREFHERLLSEIVDATRDLAPGRERLLASARTYLDACLRDRGVRALLLEARAEPVIAGEVQQRNRSNAMLLEDDFRSIGFSHPLDSARLWVALVAEAALVELAAGERTDAIRAALEQYLPTGGA